MQFYARFVLVFLCFLIQGTLCAAKDGEAKVSRSEEETYRFHKGLVEIKKSLAKQLAEAEQCHETSKNKLKEVEANKHDQIFYALLEEKKVPKDVIKALRDVKATEKLIRKLRMKIKDLDKRVIETFGVDRCLDVSPRAKGPVDCLRVDLK